MNTEIEIGGVMCCQRILAFLLPLPKTDNMSIKTAIMFSYIVTKITFTGVAVKKQKNSRDITRPRLNLIQFHFGSIVRRIR